MNKNCMDCKYFKLGFGLLVAPIGPIRADGKCLNENNKYQPIIIDSKTDNCKHYVNKKATKAETQERDSKGHDND